MNTAPIVLFVYNRPWHTRKTVEALQANELATISDLIIYSDGARNSESVESVQEVRNFIKSISGFKSVKIFERDKNWGLAANIIDGVTTVVNQYGKVIVMEDDIVTSPAFLKFMNQMLDYYEKEKKVWHVSGWNYPIETEGLGDFFFWRVMNCWGWATWADRWSYFKKNPKELVKKWDKTKKKHFDLDGSGVFWNQVLRNAYSSLDTWAIFWYASIYENNGLCLNPTISFVKNIGHDGSGTNCSSSKISQEISSEASFIEYPVDVLESEQAVHRIKFFYKINTKSLFLRGVNKFCRSFFNKNLF
ncbi:glycosyltransferase [Marinobacterium marinum]|uniref:Glycosyltransferase n=1 Tax=Marinobacterium marinum TaxID=2756129 RepID=A0A7W1WWH5_9GAMM|nr:glycosyltransferase [Marinobacterium marinum]MBA4501515.1 glycosyltransferase [Marinobacterium marinum]